VIGLLLALYPATWRRRYGEEFRAILESRALGPYDVADVLVGALDARFSLRLTAAASHDGGRLSMVRIGGIGAIAGSTLWVAGFIGASVSGTLEALWVLPMFAGTFGILVALIGLSAFQARSNPRLVWAAFVIPAVGSVVSLVGMYGMATMPDTDMPYIGAMGSWEVWALGSMATLVGCALFAAATVRTSGLSRRGAWGLAISSITIIVMGLGAANGLVGENVGPVLQLGTFLAFAASWVAIGASALRRGPIRTIAPGVSGG
jgi:hypothetical protein